MNIESFRIYGLSLPETEEKLPFGPDTLVLYVGGKMFALTSLTPKGQGFANLKHDVEDSVLLRDHYHGITPGYHMHKKMWNSVYYDSDVEDTLFKKLICDSYLAVIMTLKKSEQKRLLTLFEAWHAAQAHEAQEAQVTRNEHTL